MSEKRNLVRELLDRHCLITPEAHEILEDLDIDVLNIDKLADVLKNEIVVTGEKLQEALASFEETLSEGIDEREIEPQKPVQILDIPKVEIPEEKLTVQGSKKVRKVTTVSDFDPIGKRVKTKIKILHESSGKTTVEGTIADFRKYFNSRFDQMKTILRRRGDISGAIKISELDKAKLDPNEEISIIGIVTEKHTLKNGGMIITVEDPTGPLKMTISSKMQDLVAKAGALLQDQIAGFFGRIYDDMFLLKDFVFPDIPISSKRVTIDEPISVCMTSDLHIGSKEFLENSFNKFIDFLNGRVDDPYQRSLASQVKYLIINGDIVEGIGIYPKQEDDLLITDIYKQYSHAAKLLAKIPEWIHILIVSGNHDACRLALPQPAISEEYAPELWNMKNVTMLSNPSTVEIHKKVFLLYHGNSFEDISSLTPGLSMSEPNGPMIYTLRYRHLAPTFGRRTSIVPSDRDELVIETIPHVYHTGHVHVNSHTQYRGVECINSGTFQAQTEYMLSKNINPTPGRVPILNLQTNKLHELVFYDEK